MFKQFLAPAIIISLLGLAGTGAKFYWDHVYLTQLAYKRGVIRQLIWDTKDRAVREDRNLNKEEETRIEKWEDRLEELKNE